MYVPVTDTGEPFYSEGFVVRFYKADGLEWVANFQPGWSDLKQVIEFEKTQNILVIANGTCYLMDPNETKPIDVFGASYSNIFKAGNDRLVLQDLTDLTIVEPDGSHWNSKRISWDGLKEIKVMNNCVTGLSYNPILDGEEWNTFTYDLNTKRLTGGSF